MLWKLWNLFKWNESGKSVRDETNDLVRFHLTGMLLIETVNIIETFLIIAHWDDKRHKLIYDM